LAKRLAKRNLLKMALAFGLAKRMLPRR